MKTNQLYKHKIAAAAGVLMALGISANAQTLEHYYYGASGDITVDQVGTANGTLEGTASLSSGNLLTDGTGGGLVGGVPSNGMLLNSASVSGITGAFTIVDWYSCVQSSGNHTHLFDLSDGTTANLLVGLPVDQNGMPYASHVYSGVGGTYTDVYGTSYNNGVGGAWTDTGGTFQMAVTYDGSTLSMYINGQLQPTAALSGFDLSLLTTVGVAGGSPWAQTDPSINGTTYSFGIFNGALSQSQITSLYNAGDSASVSQINTAITAVPEPGTLALSGLGGLALLFMRNRFKR